MQRYKYKPLNTDKSELRLISLLPSTNVDDVISFSIFHASFPCEYDLKAEDANNEAFLSRVNAGLKLGWTALGISNGRIVYYNEGKCKLQSEHPGARPALLRRHRHSIRGLGVDAKIPSSVGSGVPQFEALSYVWGSADNPVTVQVSADDERQTTVTEPGFSLAVRQNLAQALRHLRREDSPRILWIDAICINQEDLQERAAQVSRMGAIYRHAAGVVVWLGPASASSSQALSDLADYGGRYLCTLDSQLIPNPATHPGGILLPAMRMPEDWLPAILDLVTRPWFYRLWTLQEARLGAPRAVLQCGSDSMPWELLVQAVSRMFVDWNRNSLYSPWLNQFARIIATCSIRLSTSMVMRLCRVRQSADPRDKVYGVLSLLQPDISKRIVIDYNRPLQQVYQDVFIAHLKTSSRLDLMLFAGFGFPAPGMPSWMPAWTVKFKGWESPEDVMLSSSASGYTDTVWSTTRGNPNVMAFVGTRPLRVTWVSELLETAHDVYSLMLTYGSAAMKDENPEALDAFVHFLYSGKFKDRIDTPSAKQSLQECREEVLDDLGCYEGQRCRMSDWSGHSCNARIEDIYKYRGLQFPYKIIRTEDGFLGQCSVRTNVGDRVAVLLGCSVPVLLRPVGMAGQGISTPYKFVGMCHVPGKMDGQAVLGVIPEPWKPLYITTDHGHSTLVFIKGDFITSNNKKRFSARNDPRLAKVPVPKGWKELGPTLKNDLPDYQFDYAYKWKHKGTKRIIRSDPRLLPRELLKRGVELQTYLLI